MFLIVSSSFDENVKVTCIYIYICIYCVVIFLTIFHRHFYLMFLRYTYIKNHGETYIYIYTCNLDMF